MARSASDRVEEFSATVDGRRANSSSLSFAKISFVIPISTLYASPANRSSDLFCAFHPKRVTVPSFPVVFTCPFMPRRRFNPVGSETRLFLMVVSVRSHLPVPPDKTLLASLPASAQNGSPAPRPEEQPSYRSLPLDSCADARGFMYTVHAGLGLHSFHISCRLEGFQKDRLPCRQRCGGGRR